MLATNKRNVTRKFAPLLLTFILFLLSLLLQYETNYTDGRLVKAYLVGGIPIFTILFMMVLSIATGRNKKYIRFGDTELFFMGFLQFCFWGAIIYNYKGLFNG